MPPRTEDASSNAVIDGRRHRNGHHRHRKSAIHRRRLRRDSLRHHRRDSLRLRHYRSAAPNRNQESRSCGQSTPGPIHSCDPRRSPKLTDTLRGRFLLRSCVRSRPIHIAKKASRPVLRDKRIPRAAEAPTLRREPDPSCPANSRHAASCLANHHHAASCFANRPANCLAELHVVTAPIDAMEPSAALIRWARDRCSSRAAEAHCAPPDSTEHCPAQPDYWPLRQLTAAAARCAQHFPDSRSAPSQSGAQRSYCPAS